MKVSTLTSFITTHVKFNNSVCGKLCQHRRSKCGRNSIHIRVESQKLKGELCNSPKIMAKITKEAC